MCKSRCLVAELPPIIDHINSGPAIARLQGTVHGNAGAIDAEAAREQATIRIVARKIDAGFQLRYTGGRSERVTRVDKRVEMNRAVRTRTNRSEFYVALVIARFGAGPNVTHREADKLTVVSEQDGFAEMLHVHRADFTLHVQAGIHRVRQTVAGLKDRVMIVRWYFRKLFPGATRGCFVRNRLQQDRCEEARIEPILLI